MKVYKFGGASVKDAAAIKNLSEILRQAGSSPLLVVISAMGKTTNALERVVNRWYDDDIFPEGELSEVIAFHENVARELDPTGKLNSEAVVPLNQAIRDSLRVKPASFDEGYDKIVSFGELYSTKIISTYLQTRGIGNEWLDARALVITDSRHRLAGINWELTGDKIRRRWNEVAVTTGLAITQGFIGSDTFGHITTLGREGSDFTAAIFAWALNATSVVIWKDVDGVYNADPHHFKLTVKFDSISYRDAIELAYYGASVIHPRTIQPLQNKSIPLWVKSFQHPERTGTLISDSPAKNPHYPSFIVRDDQVLISISPLDFSFIIEENLYNIFGILTETGIKVNLMQNTAISFSVCVDYDRQKLAHLLARLKEVFSVKYNEGLKLITIRDYTEAFINDIVSDNEIYLEQRSRTTAQLVVKNQ